MSLDVTKILSMLALAPKETNPPRRGGPLCPPAQENVTVGFCDDDCLAGTGLPLARWMHPVRAEVAGCYAKSRCPIGSAGLGGNARGKCGATIPDGSSYGMWLSMGELAIEDGARPASRRM